MALAMLYPEAKHGGKRTKGASLAPKLEGVSGYGLSRARAVLRWSRAAADAGKFRHET